MGLPTDSKIRKMIPLWSGLFVFFPDALAAIAHRSYVGSKQHHPDEPVSWDRSKSTDELDAMLRHVLDEDWEAVAWRACSNLQKQIERGYDPYKEEHDANQEGKHD